MSNNPLNLTLRFFLELAALFALGIWGWTQHQGVLRFILAAGLPFLAAVLWGTFSVPGDRPGAPPVPVAGFVRLALEAIIFGSAVWALYASGHPGWGFAFGLIVLFHYVISYDRISRLVRQP